MATAPALFLALVATAPPPAGGEVTLPLEAYSRLVEAAANKKQPASPPVDASVRQAAYHVTATGPQARVKMAALVDVLGAQRVVIPLLGSSAALVELKVDKQPAGAVVLEDRYAVELKPGTHDIEMEVVVPVASEGPSEVHLAVPEALAAGITAELPGANVSVQIGGVSELDVRRSARTTLVKAALPVTSMLSMSWVQQGADEGEDEVEEPERPAETTPGKARASVIHHLGVDEALIRGMVRVTLSVKKGTRSQAALTLPANVEVLDVQAADMREWNATAEGGRKKVLVLFKYGRTGEIPVTVRYERPLRQGGDEAAERAIVDVPEPIVLDVDAERGFLGVETAPGVEVALHKSEGAEALDGRDLPSELWSMAATPLVLGVKYLEHPVNVALSVSQRAKVAVADTTLDRADFETVINADGRAVSAVTYHVRNHQRQYLEVTLPAKTEVLSCFVNGKAVRPARGEGEALFIPLDRSTAAEGAGASFPVELIIAQETGKLWPLGRLSLVMPSTAVQSMELGWRLYLPTSHVAVDFGGNFSVSRDPRSTERWFSGLVSTSTHAFAGGDWSSNRKGGDALEGYDFSQGVKARFAQNVEDVQVATAVRVSRPLVGRLYDFRANLLRSEAPQLSLVLVRREALSESRTLALFLTLAGAFCWAERRRRRQAGRPVLGAPWNMAGASLIAGITLALVVGLYVNDVVARTAMTLFIAPVWLLGATLKGSYRRGARKLGWPPYVLAWGALALAILVAVTAESFLGTGFLLVIGYALARLAARWLIPPPSSASPPSGTPVSGGTSTSGGAQ